MHFLLGVVATLLAFMAPWHRSRGMTAYPVAGGPVPRITGLADYLQTPSATVNLVIVHGMGAGPKTDYVTFTRSVVGYLGFRQVAEHDEPILGNPPDTAPARLLIRNFDRQVAGGTQHLTVYELHWWPLIQFEKQRLSVDDSYYPGKRAFFNRHLKADLMNQRVADPIIYLSQKYGGAIRNSVKFTLCKVAGGSYTGNRCRSTGPLTGDGDSTIAIVTESLGS